MIAAEFRGLARVFRNDVLEADRRISEALPEIAEPIRQRLRRKPTLRPDTILDSTRAWSERVTDGFTLAISARVTKTDFALCDQRLSAGRWLTTIWETAKWQDGLSLCWVGLTVSDGKLNLIVQPTAHLLLHALARRFERGDGRTTADVVRDLRLLGDALGNGAAGNEISVPGGRWLGEKQVVHDEGSGRSVPLFHAKTFVN